MLDIASVDDCAPLDALTLTPTHTNFVYEFRDLDGNPTGIRNHLEFQEQDDGTILITETAERSGEMSGFVSTKTVRHGLFVELPPRHERNIAWSYDYDTDAVQALSGIEVGQTVEVRTVSTMRVASSEYEVDDVYRVTHEGCSMMEVAGTPILVHTLRLDFFNQYLDRTNSAKTQRSAVTRDYSPEYGWWVAERHPSYGSVVVVETRD